MKWNRAIFQSMGGGGNMGFANRGPKRGSGGRVWEGETSPSQGFFFFSFRVSKNDIFLHIKFIIIIIIMCIIIIIIIIIMIIITIIITFIYVCSIPKFVGGYLILCPPSSKSWGDMSPCPPWICAHGINHSKLVRVVKQRRPFAIETAPPQCFIHSSPYQCLVIRPFVQELNIIAIV